MERIIRCWYRGPTVWSIGREMVIEGYTGQSLPKLKQCWSGSGHLSEVTGDLGIEFPDFRVTPHITLDQHVMNIVWK